MYNFFLSTISCVCIICAGSSLSLSCVVVHCEGTWKENWTWENTTNQSEITIVEESARHHLTSVTISGNETQLKFKFLHVDQSDEGSYRCKVNWSDGSTGVGHWMQVNITKAVPSQRQYLHRVLVYAGASLCLPVILGLARCLSSRIKPQSHPRIQVTYTAVQRNQPHMAPNPPQPPPRCPVPQKRSIPTQKAFSKSQKKTEVVYADISQEALGQREALRESGQATVYSSLKFS
ncbi:uncharacterized protein si:dkey-52l18.4 isoform X2 [Melanotaenia boesemani]|uniref:uncharacterized protein si:dkey-52l18.4 isoform X2 n=1 Tax=Melanotaenia boesemani TaxID=1250792 RepID=UPI001C04E278|nr:uncharacterized protein si:dkey-52l18.4 isoform X2 [Melanotaenia boesemani]